MSEKFYSAKKIQEYLDRSLETQIHTLDKVLTMAGYKRICTESVASPDECVMLCAKLSDASEAYLVRVKGSVVTEATMVEAEISPEAFALELMESYIQAPEAVKSILSAD